MSCLRIIPSQNEGGSNPNAPHPVGRSARLSSSIAITISHGTAACTEFAHNNLGLVVNQTATDWRVALYWPAAQEL